MERLEHQVALDTLGITVLPVLPVLLVPLVHQDLLGPQGTMAKWVLLVNMDLLDHLAQPGRLENKDLLVTPVTQEPVEQQVQQVPLVPMVRQVLQEYLE